MFEFAFLVRVYAFSGFPAVNLMLTPSIVSFSFRVHFCNVWLVVEGFLLSFL